MDDQLITQLLDTQGDADFGDSDLIKMRKVSCILNFTASLSFATADACCLPSHNVEAPPSSRQG
jgi:hypothetical protein